MSTESADLAALLRWKDEMESRQAIADLVSNYPHGFDKHDEERFRGIWHEDAEWLTTGRPKLVGHEAILGYYRHRTASVELEQGLYQLHHHTMNLVIDLDGDTAHGMSDVHAPHVNVDGTQRTVVSSYYDRYERRDGKWKIARRECKVHHWVLGGTVSVEPEGLFAYSPPFADARESA